MKKIILSTIMCIITSNVYAVCVQTDNTIGLVGVGAGGHVQPIIYANITSDKNECSCNLARFSATNTDTKMVLTVLMAAKLADKKIRIDWLTEGDCNSAFRVYIQ